jgi:hypothetical protein
VVEQPNAWEGGIPLARRQELQSIIDVFRVNTSSIRNTVLGFTPGLKEKFVFIFIY